MLKNAANEEAFTPQRKMVINLLTIYFSAKSAKSSANYAA